MRTRRSELLVAAEFAQAAFSRPVSCNNNNNDDDAAAALFSILANKHARNSFRIITVTCTTMTHIVNDFTAIHKVYK